MENPRLLNGTGSSVTQMDWKTAAGDQRESGQEYTFWTSLDGRLGVQHHCLSGAAFYQPHTHSEYTIMVCLSGSLTKIELEGTDMAGCGEIMVSNAGVEHATGNSSGQDGRFEVIYLSFDRKMLAALAGDFQLPAVTEGACPAFTGTCRSRLAQASALEIVRELQGRGAGHKILIEILALRLLVEVLRSWPRGQITEVMVNDVPRLSQRDFIRAYEFMRRCRKGTFRLQHLCSFLGMSKERFTRLFLASTRVTPASFYNRMLLEQGRGLLQDRALSIKEISFQLGFKTTSHFIVAFRREFSASPQEYRHRNLMAGQGDQPALTECLN